MTDTLKILQAWENEANADYSELWSEDFQLQNRIKALCKALKLASTRIRILEDLTRYCDPTSHGCMKILSEEIESIIAGVKK